MRMLKDWWKFIGIFLILFVIYKGFTIDVPQLEILNESIRSIFFHVPMWFGMMLLLFGSLIFSIRFLSSGKINHDIWSSSLAKSGILLGFLGLTTGMMWGNYTWGTPWPNDPKLHGASITLLIYMAYQILRNAIKDEDKKGKISAVYNVFAYAMLIVFLVVYPRSQSSLHPGAEGNPGFNQYDLDSNLRMIFYPAIIGWFIIGLWISQLTYRLKLKENELLYINSKSE